MATSSFSRVWRFQEPIVDRVCRIVFAGPHFHAGLPCTARLLAEHHHHHTRNQVELIHAKTDDELMHYASTADVALPFMQRFDASFLQAAPNLRLVQQFGVGLEGVDVDCATDLGIAVSNIPAQQTRNAEATAEHGLLLTLALLRGLPTELPRRFQAGELGGLPIPRTLCSKRVTVVGYGAVGSTICSYLQAMGAHVTAVRRQWPDDDADDDNNTKNIVKATNLQQVLPTTEVLILACVLTPETLHLMNQATLGLLPPRALVVNIGRGPLVEYNGLLHHLQNGHLGGFASDVGVGHATKPSEPWDAQDPINHCHPNVMFTPHVGGYCDVPYDHMTRAVVDAIECVVRGQPPRAWANGP